MKHYSDITPALQSILLHYTRGYTLWVSFMANTEKLPRIEEKWTETLGINLPSWKRQDRKQKMLANAVALSGPILGIGNKSQIILMATEHALTMPKVSVWSREQWQSRLPVFSDFVMTKESRERGGSAWTWRLQGHIQNGLERYLVGLVKSGNAPLIQIETQHWAKLYPMYGGTRRQLRKILSSSRKLWQATMKSEWPGLDPENLPIMVGFK